MKKLVLPVIIISQFCCTSLWFAGNGIMDDLILNFDLSKSALGHLTSAVQFGFITGTLSFAILTIADRFPPSRVFFFSALLGALFNFGVIWEGNSLASILGLRFMTGFFLAGIYPVGMKIAADYYEKGLGVSLGFLVGALVIGTAFPHILKGLSIDLEWKTILATTSLLAILGGFLMWTLVPSGPFRTKGSGINLSAFFKVFEDKSFRVAAFGYFAHMWELYSFWAFVPVMLGSYLVLNSEAAFNIPLLSFSIIGIGGIACVIGGYVSQAFGVKRTAFLALLLSGICCLVSPLMFYIDSPVLFVVFLLIWGMVVIADSPLFSTLVARHAISEFKGTALTIVNCIGFSITIVSIQLLNWISQITSSTAIFMVLAIGPILGLIIKSSKN